MNLRRFIYFLSGFSFPSEFYFRTTLNSTTYPCAWPGNHSWGWF